MDMVLKEYKILWEIDVIASSPEEAVSIARQCQTDHDTTATVFGVYKNDKLIMEIDTLEIDLETNP